MYSVSREMTGAFSDWGGGGGRIFFNTIVCYVLAKSLKLCSISTFEQPIHASFLWPRHKSKVTTAFDKLKVMFSPELFHQFVIYWFR